MIVDPTNHINWPPRRIVWDCERCRTITNVDYVDDEARTYRRLLEPLRVDPHTNDIAKEWLSARRIVILGTIILVNPLVIGDEVAAEQVRAGAA